jgi:hypothetical protein
VTRAAPYWPAALPLDQAAAYCGLSVEIFKAVCPVKPMTFTQSTRGHRYLRQRLDEWLLSRDQNIDYSNLSAFERWKVQKDARRA